MTFFSLLIVAPLMFSPVPDSVPMVGEDIVPPVIHRGYSPPAVPARPQLSRCIERRGEYGDDADARIWLAPF
jgi:hypothetical protein